MSSETQASNDTSPTGGSVDAPKFPKVPPQAEATPRPAGESAAARWKDRLSFRRISGIYLFIVVFVVFALIEPKTFLSSITLTSVLSEQAVTTMVAIALVVALASGVFDLSVGAIMGVGAAVTAWLVVNHAINPWIAAAAALVTGLLVGLLNSLIVVRFKVDSFIGTLGVQSILFAILLWVTNGQQIVGLPASFLSAAYNKWFGIPIPFYIMLFFAIVLWYMMELTPLGRYIEATGGNRDAARLAGLQVGRLTTFAFVVCGGVSAIAGVVLLTRISGAGPTTGSDYVLPVFAAAFLGRTQFRPGRFNVWGTVLAVYLLAMITKGLELHGAQPWLTQLFYGVALILAVSASNVERRQRVSRSKDTDAGATGVTPVTPEADTVHSHADGGTA